MMMGDWIEVSDAAVLLGVQPGRVRQLIAAGDIEAEQRSGRWWASTDGVQRLAAMERDGRPFSPRTAWAVLAGLAPGLIVPVQDRRQAWRIDRYVPDVRRGSGLGRLRQRAALVVGRVHPGLLDLVRDNLVLGGAAALPSSLAERLVEDDRMEGYLSEASWTSLAADVPMSSEGRLNLQVRLVKDELWPFPIGARVAPVIVGAVDLLERPDGRARRAGQAAFAWSLPEPTAGR